MCEIFRDPDRAALVRQGAVWHLVASVADLGPEAVSRVHAALKRDLLDYEVGTVRHDAVVLAMNKLASMAEIHRKVNS